MNQIKAFFKQRFDISESDWEIFSSKLAKFQYFKKHTLLKVGQIENYLSFVEKGIIRSFIPKEEKDITFVFAFENDFVSGYSSFLTQTPSIYQIETLTETILWRLKFEDLQTIYNETKIGNYIGRKASEDLFLKKSKRELSLLNETAEQRYLNLFKDQPKLISQIPLKYIASYIGVTPQALSRIRKRIS